MIGYNEIAIPVADANMASDRSFLKFDENAVQVRDNHPKRQFLHAGLVVWALIHCTGFLFVPELGFAVRLLTIARYLLWPTILVATLLHVVRKGSGELAHSLAPVTPYFIIGVLTGLIGYDPIGSARLLVFWLFGVFAAGLGGTETSGRVFRRALAMAFAVMIAASIGFVLLKPEYGVVADNRAAGGTAWRGLFVGKNLLGLIAVYGLLMPVVITEVSFIFRFLSGGVAIVTLAFASSQGASLTAVAMVGYVVSVWLLQRLGISKTARTLVLIGIICAMVSLVVFGLPLLLDLLHRDASLTGRSSVWPQWLARAMTHWLTGYGPGSFTNLSFITIDLTMSDIALGSINTPHNMFIAIFGEVGIFGLFAFTLPMLYFILVVPFAGAPKAGCLVGAVAFVTVVGGISETREVFGLGMNMFVLIASYANFRRSIAQESRLVEDGPNASTDQSLLPPLRGIPVLGA